MGGYVVNFGVYTMAMLGLIFFALMVYKKCSGFGDFVKSKSQFLNVEEVLSIAPRKTLYVVRAGNERFLLAGDIDKTTLISKLNSTDIDAGMPEQTQYSQSMNYTQRAPRTAMRSGYESHSYISQEPTNLSAEKITQVRKSTGKSKKLGASVDDIPVIVDFPKTKDNNDVLHNMLRKINE